MAAPSNGLPVLERHCSGGSTLSVNPTCGDTASEGLEKKAWGREGVAKTLP